MATLRSGPNQNKTFDTSTSASSEGGAENVEPTQCTQEFLHPHNRPFVARGDHPIETGRYLLATPAIDSMCDKVTRWLDNRTPGGIIYGRPRLGKSRAIKYLINEIKENYGSDLPVYQILRKSTGPNENAFFEDLLRAVGHGITNGKTSDKRDRLTSFLLERAWASGKKRIIFIIDEAQNLHRQHYNWLMDLFNELEVQGTSMSVILVGQEELLQQRTVFLHAKKQQIVGRFMLSEHLFRGVTNIAELSECLAGYDDDCEYPLGSGWSFTRYFFPEHVSDGFRLQACAADIFDAFIELRKGKGIHTPLEIPMQYLTLTIEYCLKRYGVNGDPVPRLLPDHWCEGIKQSGFVDSEIFSILGEQSGAV